MIFSQCNHYIRHVWLHRQPSDQELVAKISLEYLTLFLTNLILSVRFILQLFSCKATLPYC